MTTNGVKYTVSIETPKPKPVITQINKESLMLMMKEIMQKSSIVNDQLHCVVQESNQCSQSMVENLLIEPFQSQQKRESQQYRNSPQKKNFQKDLNSVEKPSSQKLLNDFAQCDKKSSNIPDCQMQKNKSSSLCKNTEESSQSQSYTTQFDKLIEITSRCIQYYNNFIKQKSVEFTIIQKTFTDLNSNLDIAFGEIISEAQRKQKQLKEFLLKKYKQIIDYRQYQDNGLKDTLQNIRSVHLNRIIKKQTVSRQNNLKDSKRKLNLSLNQKLQTEKPANENIPQKNLLNSYESQQSVDLSIEMHNYATTLNQFYLQMEQIEKSNFKQMVEQSVSFINNLICQELKVLMTERIPSKLCEKRMLRENSKDFLMDQNLNQNETKTNNNAQNLAFLDFQSFTKLFMDNSKISKGDEQMAQDTKKIQEIISLIQQKNKPQIQKRLNTYNNEKALTNLNSNQLKKQKSKQKNSNSRSKTTYQVKVALKKQRQFATDHSNKSLNKTTNFSKKSHHIEQIVPTTLKIQTEDVHKQNSLQLIKKISSQQNNRSAKIKSYMVSFQDTTNKQKVCLKADEMATQQNKMMKNSKSPCKLSKTPTKMTKSNERKSLASSANQINSSSDIKFKSSQQTSLKSSRNSGYVSEFKIATSRRKSVALK